MSAQAERFSVERGEASLDLGSDEANRPRQDKAKIGKPQLLEPPGADPHAGWCGRGRSGNLTAPIPIAAWLRVREQPPTRLVFDDDSLLRLASLRREGGGGGRCPGGCSSSVG